MNSHQEYLATVRTLMAEQGAGVLVQGDGQTGIRNEALIPYAVEDYNRRHPDAPLRMPELALSNFEAVTKLKWVPGSKAPIFSQDDSGVRSYVYP